MQDAAFEGVKWVGKGEGVQVAQDDNLCARGQGQDAVDEIIDDLRLLSALGLGTEHRRLEAAKERVVSALGVKVIGDDKQLLTVEGKLARERFATVVEGSVSRIDAAGTEGELDPGWAIRHRRGAGRTSTGTVCEGEAAIGAEKKTDTNIAAGLAPVLVINRVDLAESVGRAAGCLNGGDQGVVGGGGIDYPIVSRPIVILDLFNRDDVRRTEGLLTMG